MLAATARITTDIVSAPLLWALPLALYLVSYISAFAPRLQVDVTLARRLLLVVCLVLGAAELGVVDVPIGVAVALHLCVVLLVGLACHRLTRELRPAAHALTGYYLLLSVGGVLGGLLVAIVAPVLLDDVFEYPLLIAAALLVAAGADGVHASGAAGRRHRTWALVGWAGLVLVAGAWTARALELLPADEWTGAMPWWAIALAAAGIAMASREPRALAVAAVVWLLPMSLFDPAVLRQERTFFGVVRVAEQGREHVMYHGTTVHGSELCTREGRGEPRTYYARGGPAGDLMASVRAAQEGSLSVVVVGLGAGSLAAYAQPGDAWTFVEIDRAVIELARDRQLFGFVDQAPGEVRIVEGDGRLAVADRAHGEEDLVVLDAFSSDSIPAHLVTTDAMRTYLDRLRPGGAAAVHVSSRMLRVDEAVAALARELELVAAVRRDAGAAGGTGLRSVWVVLGERGSVADDLLARPDWERLEADASTVAWSDDYSNFLALVDWSRVWS